MFAGTGTLGDARYHHMGIPGRLTDTAIRALKPKDRPYKVTDGLGLYLLVNPNGSRLWRLAYRFAGRQKLLALGRYPEVGLAEARRRALDARELLARGRDPSAERRARRLVAERTFRVLAERWYAERARVWRPRTAAAVRQRLDAHVLPALGERPVESIEPVDVLALVRRLADRPETARRVHQYISQVMRWAVAHGLARRNPAADVVDALPPKVETPRAAILEPRRFGQLLRAIWGYEGSPVVRAALQLLAYTFVRPGELRGMRWAELDPAAGEWRIPPVRTKMKDLHVVPLAPQVLAILEGLRPLTGTGELVLPGMRPGRPLSENTLNAALRTLGFGKEEMTAHGFRAAASTMLNEAGFPADVIERQLAHAPRNKVRAAYNRAAYLEERRRMMRWWADHIDALREGRV